MAKQFLGTVAIARVFQLVKNAIKTLQDSSLTTDNLIDDFEADDIKNLDLALAQNKIYKSINAKTAKRLATSIVANTTAINTINDNKNTANGFAALDSTGKLDETVIPASDRALLNKVYNANTAGCCVVLDSNGLITSDVLPSYVDDVLEGVYIEGDAQKGDYFETADNAYGNKAGVTSLTKPEKGKIYVDTDTNIQYRWGGTKFIPILSSDGVELTADDIDTIWESVTV